MSAEDFSKARELFEQAVELAPERRGEFLERSCGADPELRRQVERLLAADGEAGGFLEQPAVPGVRIHDTASEGERIGAYRILRRIGEGGMSEVYLAVRADDEYQKRVALKIIRQDLGTEDRLRRFRTERQILAGLDHPSIAKMLDGGTTEAGLPYFVMDYIDGVPIDDYCDRNRLSVRERLNLFLTVCSAVQYAHQNLVVHRDIKPSNILVNSDGEVRLLDFGIAKLLKPDQFAEEVEYTATWVRPMTPKYASPEQVQGKLVTTASDVYSLGVLLYELLTGHLPYRLESRPPTELARMVVEEEAERPSTAIARVETGVHRGSPDEDVTPETVSQSRRTPVPQLRRQLSGDLDNVVLMALRKEAPRRYASVEQFAEDVRRYLKGHPVVARKDTVGYRTTKFLRRNWLAVGVAAAFVVLLAGFSVTMALQARRIAHERDQARVERDRAEQVVGFMERIFEVSDPAEAKGEEISAREILDRGAERITKDLANQPEVQATLIQAIGNVYKNLGVYGRAAELAREALEIRRRLYGPRHTAVADSLQSLGVVVGLEEDYDQAESLLREALEMRRALLPPDDPDVVASLTHLGVVLRQRGEYEAAESLYREALEREAALGAHPEMVTAKNNLGTLLAEIGDLPGAEPLFREAMRMRRELMGERHPLVAQSMSNLGAVLGMQGKFDEAEPYLRGALELYRELLDEDHPALVESLNNLAKLMQRQGDPAAAEDLYREALRIERGRLGGWHPRLAHVASNLAEVLQDMGEFEEAESFAREALRIRRSVLDERHADLGSSLVRLAGLLLATDRPGEAEPLLVESLDVFAAALPADHWRPALARSLLGGCLVEKGQFEEAEPLLIAGYEGLEAKRGPDHPFTRAARGRVVELYRAWGRPEAAAEYSSNLPE